MKRASMGAGSGNGEEEDLEKKGEKKERGEERRGELLWRLCLCFYMGIGEWKCLCFRCPVGGQKCNGTHTKPDPMKATS